MTEISEHERVRCLTAVVVGALGATLFMISVILPDEWCTSAMLVGAAVTIGALAVMFSALAARPR